MSTRRHLLRHLGSAALALAATPALQAQDKPLIGIAMPTKSAARWIADGEHMRQVFQARGYRADLQFADDDIPNQLAQIENLITKGARVLVIAPIDGSTLGPVLRKAADRQIKVIAYDRLIRGTPHVDGYATFDNYQVGVMQARSIVDRLGLSAGKGPFNLELFAGSPDDNNARVFFDGSMSVLKPLIDSGRLVVRSRQLAFEKVGTLRWDAGLAQARMDNLLSAHYGQERLHAVLSPYDGLSIGVLSSLKGVGYCTPRQPCPVVTGQDAELPSVKSIQRGEQASTIFKDTRELAKVAAGLAEALLAGRTPEFNDRKSYHNGVKVVPAQLLGPVAVDAGNWQKVLVDSGYYTAAQLR